MSPTEVMRSSARPCRVHTFLPRFPGVLCAEPGDADTSMAVGFTPGPVPGRVFALLLRFCSPLGFAALAGEIGGRYRVALVGGSETPEGSRGARFGNGLVLALNQDGLCRNGDHRVALLLADQNMYARAASVPDPVPAYQP